MARLIGAVKLREWAVESRPVSSDQQRRQRDIIFSDRTTGLRVRCELTEFTAHQAVEWVLKLENCGKKETPVLADILPLDMTMTLPGDSPVLHYSKGSLSSMDDFAPHANGDNNWDERPS